MTVDALQLRRARRAVYGPPATAAIGIALALIGVVGLVTTNRPVVDTGDHVRILPPKVATDRGYAVVGADGRIYTNGDSGVSALLPQGVRGAQIVGAARGLSGGWLLASADGRVFASNTPSHGSVHLPASAAKIIGIASAGNGGYWLASAQGDVYAVGAPDFGSLHTKLKSPVVAIASAPDGGFWLTTRDGQVFGFGTSALGSLPNGTDAKIVGIAASPDGGYWLPAADGRVFAFGNASHYGGLTSPPKHPIVSIAVPQSGGYWLTTATGDVYAIGGAPHLDSLGDAKLPAPIVAIAPR